MPPTPGHPGWRIGKQSGLGQYDVPGRLRVTADNPARSPTHSGPTVTVIVSVTMNWTDLRGHADRVDMLRRSLQRGRLAHAYLFAGPPGIGKSRFARIFAQGLLCERCDQHSLNPCDDCSACRQMNGGSHPDFFTVGCPEGKTEIPVAAFFGSPERRGKEGLIHDLSLKPMAGDRRIAIIDDANRMNDEGANAMLKTLEEPPANSLLILVAENLDAVLPTIRSRCQLLRFAPLATNDVAELLVENEIASSPEEAAAAAGMSDGSLQMAAQLLNPALRSLRERLFGFLSAPDMNPLEAAATMTAGLDELGSETSEHRRNANWLIRFAQEFYRQTLLSLSGATVSASTVPQEVETFARRMEARGHDGTELVMSLFDRCVLAESHIGWNVQPARTLESLFDDLARQSRKQRPVSAR